MKNVEEAGFFEKNRAILLDAVFLLSYFTAVVFLAAMVADVIFFVPAAISCVLWLTLSLTVSKTQGRDIKLLIRHGKLMPSAGLPSNRKLHAVYTAALLVSFMLFFSLMIIMTELSMMLAFVSWLFVGYATLQDISEKETGAQKSETR